MNRIIKIAISIAAAAICCSAAAQRYKTIDKSIAVVGGELITISDLEGEIFWKR